jgi:hypothetical protein
MYEKMLLIMNWTGREKKIPKVAYICVPSISSNLLISVSKNSFARFEVLTEVLVKINSLWDVMLCRLVNSNVSS